MTTQLTPEAFVAKCRGNTSTERQVYQQHFLDLCALVQVEYSARIRRMKRFGGRAGSWNAKNAKCAKDTKDVGAFVSFAHSVTVVFQALSPQLAAVPRRSGAAR